MCGVGVGQRLRGVALKCTARLSEVDMEFRGPEVPTVLNARAVAAVAPG